MSHQHNVMRRLQAALGLNRPGTIGLLLVVVLHPFLFHGLRWTANLGESAYFSPVISLQVLQSPTNAVLLLLTILAFYYRGTSLTWKHLDSTHTTRVLVAATAGILSWVFVTYQTNHYFGQEHLFDRFLLLALWLGIVAHPLFIFPFLLLMTSISWQFHYPVFNYGWSFADKRLLFDLLVLFSGFLIVRRFVPMKRNAFILLTLCLTACFYTGAALAKLRFGTLWLVDNEVTNLFVSSRLYGWLEFVPLERILDITGWLRPLTPVLVAATILLEAAGACLIMTPRLARLALAGFILLHLSILAVSGIFFWCWILFDFVLLVLLWAAPSSYVDTLFRRSQRRCAVLVICCGMLLFRPIPFGWLDSNHVSLFRIYGRSAAGAGDTYELHPYFFSLYDLEMGQRRYAYASATPTLVGTYGTSFSPEIWSALRSAQPGDMEGLKQRFGVDEFDPERRNKLARFLVTYVNNSQRPSSAVMQVLQSLAPPHHFRLGVPENMYTGQERLESLHIVRREYLFDARHVSVLSPERILDTAIPPASEAPSPTGYRLSAIRSD